MCIDRGMEIQLGGFSHSTEINLREERERGTGFCSRNVSI